MSAVRSRHRPPPIGDVTPFLETSFRPFPETSFRLSAKLRFACRQPGTKFRREAKAGIYCSDAEIAERWIPAFAGMTGKRAAEEGGRFLPPLFSAAPHRRSIGALTP